MCLWFAIQCRLVSEWGTGAPVKILVGWPPLQKVIYETLGNSETDHHQSQKVWSPCSDQKDPNRKWKKKQRYIGTEVADQWCKGLRHGCPCHANSAVVQLHNGGGTVLLTPQASSNMSGICHSI